MGDACIERILIDATFPWRKHKLNETKYYVNQLSETPEKMNEIPLKVNDTPGRQVREKTPGKRKNGRPKSRATVVRSEFQSEKCEEKAGFLQIPRIFTQKG